jgi:hypothetical protein
MILNTFENGSKKAEVCTQDNILVIKYYEDDEYLYMQIAGIQKDAETVAEAWVNQ